MVFVMVVVMVGAVIMLGTLRPLSAELGKRSTNA